MKTINKLVILSVFAAIIILVPSISSAYYTGLCLPHSYERCYQGNIFWYDSCGNPQEVSQYCGNGCYNNSCGGDNYNNYCSYHSYQRCSGNNLYWYDSCGNQQDLAQYCSNGCYNNSCQNYNNYYNYNNYNNYSNCTYHAYKLCVGNNIYWYNSCGTQQEIYYSCQSGQTCQYGNCTYNPQNYNYNNNNIYYSNYNPYYTTKCSGSVVYWYDSLGVISGTYKNCNDKNSCTLDSCSTNKCLNTLKCDGSTCATNSADYNIYCAPKQTTPIITPTPEPTTTENPTPTPTTNPAPQTNNQAQGLSISLFAKQDAASGQWQKTAQVGSNGQVYFMISATNTSAQQIDNVTVSANIPAEITSLGNLKLDGVSISGDIVSGVNIGSIAPATTKLVTFEGKTQTISETSTKQATATSNVSGGTQADSVSINLSPTTAPVVAAVTSAPATSGFMGFLKKWYLWILVGLVLIFLFIVIYRRLSSNV